MTWIRPVTLTGSHVQLEPMAESHIPDLWRAGNHRSLWTYMPFAVTSEADVGTLVRHVVGWTAAGTGLGFVQRAMPGEEIVGATSYLNADATHRRVEIGATWVTPARQRSAINTEAKLLLLTHAFDHLHCIRVEFKTDSLNEQSRTALSRLGAVEEGTLRNHMIMPDGRYRHSTYYGITVEEWPAIRARLTSRLARG